MLPSSTDRFQNPSITPGGVPRQPPPGPILYRDVQSLEEEVQDIVRADAERARVKKLETLEQRLTAIVSHLEKQQPVLPGVHEPPGSIAPPNREPLQQKQQQQEEEKLSVLDLQKMLMSLEQMEDKEEQIR